MKKIKSINHSIYIGDKSFKEFNYKKYSKIAVLVDENTRKYCLPYFLNQVNIKPIIIEIFSGEKNKNILSCKNIWNKMEKNQFDRHSLLINLGGGLINDLGGFSASTFKRGIDFINIPTTLLAMIDASIGGKNGINFNNIKNQIGLFNFPKSVFIDTFFLTTLSYDQLLSGFTEMVKHALIFDKKYWKEIKDINLKKDELYNIIYKSINIKNKIILKDPFEKNERKKLNFGHTIGHAIESHYLSKGKEILHGEAIALGILEEIKLSTLSEKDYNEIKSFINKVFNLPKKPLKKELLKWIINDKKNCNNKISFSLLDGIGKCKIDQTFNFNELFN